MKTKSFHVLKHELLLPMFVE